MSSCQPRQIHKYHSDLAALVNDLYLATFAASFTKSLSEKSLQTLLELSPIHVIKCDSGRYECVGCTCGHPNGKKAITNRIAE